MWSFVLLAILVQQPSPLSIQVPDGEVVELSSIDSIPLDFIEFEEIDLGKESQLQIPPFKSIRIKKLIADNGASIQLSHLSSGQDGAPSVNGQDGADAVFFIDKIKGHIVIESRGGDGGAGRDGRHGQEGSAGGKGRNGIKFFFFYLSGGEDGYAGGRGGDGESGEDGGDGGDGGNIRVYFLSKSPDAKILVDVAAGLGGKGGRAGLGGLGGPGGPGGVGTKPGRQGSMGANGKNGEAGRPGVPGQAGSVAIYQVDQEFYRCLLENELIGFEEEGDWTACLQQPS